jgi:hypothetical protein
MKKTINKPAIMIITLATRQAQRIATPSLTAGEMMEQQQDTNFTRLELEDNFGN